jgi:4-amino-4-deoxy-L-arabinose transferase-like glycosyltransferase
VGRGRFRSEKGWLANAVSRASGKHPAEVLDRPSSEATRAAAPSLAIRHRLWESDRIWALGIAAAAGLLYLLMFSPRPAFGDSVESIAGVASLGILHAPGYPAYVLAARLFSILEPFGSLALRVNLFSLACAVGSSVGVFYVGRRLGATRPGAAFGSLAWTTATSVWFYAGYAKAYAFTALLLVWVFYLVLDWRALGGRWRLILAGALAGLAGGASYQVFALAFPAFAVLLLTGERRASLRDLASGAAAGVLVLAALLTFVVVRAWQHPPLNWGGPDTAARLVDLLRMKDFGFGTKSFESQQEAARPLDALRGRQSEQPSSAGRILGRLASYPGIASREFVVPVLLFAAVGAFESWTQRRRAQAAAIAAMFALNAAVVTIFVGLAPTTTYDRVVSRGGFFLAANLAVCLWAGLGATRALRWGGIDRTEPPRTRPGQGGVARGRRRKRRPPAPTTPGWAAWGAGAILALSVAWSVAAHMRPASHRSSPFAEDYAANVLEPLPQDSVVFVWAADRAFPLQYHQIVLGRRRDVEVVVADLLFRDWYRDEASRRLARPVNFPSGFTESTLSEFIEVVAAERPTYLDFKSHSLLRRVNARLEGVTAQVSGVGQEPSVTELPQPSRPDPNALLATLDGYRKRGLYSDPARLHFPSARYLEPYAGIHTIAAQGFVRLDDYEQARTQLEMALRIQPGNQETIRELRRVERVLRGRQAP